MSSLGSIQIGVDTGGTFTDLVMVYRGRVLTYKTPSTPDDFAQGVLIGIEAMLSQVPLTDDTTFTLAHSSTVATNALLERKGVKTALVTTRGFRDVLEIGRQERASLYNFAVRRPEPLVPKNRRHEIAERIDAGGKVQKALTKTDVRKLISTLKKQQVDSIAVSLLFSFLKPQHEEVLAEELRKAGFHVSASSEVIPEFREYERTSTTVINAYVSPIMKGYLERLSSEARELGAASLRVVQSNGGSLSVRAASERAVHTLLSGPAAGLTGALSICRDSLAFFKHPPDRMITFDMGGTSTDVSLVSGTPRITTESDVAGLPVKVPMLDIHTVGAGGGSLAFLDAGGALHVGPESAGADPGPACYGIGNQPTVTDANVVAGRLPAEHFLGGRLPFDPSRSLAAIGDLAKGMGADHEQAAAAVLRIVNANMERAIRVISIERGYDPRDFTLVSFGGAGGLHACELAEALHMDRVLVPRHPGVLSAWGAVTSDVIKDYSQTVMETGTTKSEATVSRVLRQLAQQAKRDMRLEGFTTTNTDLEPSIDLRYAGQSYELTVPHAGNLEHAIEAFHEAHRHRYGYDATNHPVEVVTIRLRAIGRMDAPVLEELPRDIRPGVFAPTGISGDLTVHERDLIRPAARFQGPCLVVEDYATTYVPAKWRARLDPQGNILLER